METLAQKSLKLYKNQNRSSININKLYNVETFHGTSLQRPYMELSKAQNYGFLAEVALKNQEWEKANQYAQQALDILGDIPNLPSQEYGLYRLFLAFSQIFSGDIGEVRPIELQIVGTQLQSEQIKTLEKYREFGKEKLVEKFLEDVIKDCGAEHEQTARLVLYLLTDENGTRPLRTRAEFVGQFAETPENLDLVLKIFVASGLVLLLPEFPADRYQLVHDYLVEFIRQQKGNKLLEELSKTKAKLKDVEKANKILENAKKQADAQIQQARKERNKLQLESQHLTRQIQQLQLKSQQAEKQRQTAEIKAKQAQKTLETANAELQKANTAKQAAIYICLKYHFQQHQGT